MALHRRQTRRYAKHFLPDDHPKLNLTPEEKRYFSQLFKQAANKNDTGIVTGEEAFDLFMRSNLQQELLGDIWAKLDPDNRGFLTVEEFVKALRIIGRCQSQPGWEPDVSAAIQREYNLFCVPFNHANFLVAGPLPQFDGIPPVASAPAPVPASAPAPAPASRVPVLRPEKAAEYAGLFQSRNPNKGLISGDAARQIFEQSGLPTDTLVAVWNLADTEQRGALSDVEFIVGMHLLVSLKNESMRQLPPNIPPALWSAASSRPPVAQTPVSGAIPRPFSVSQAPRTTSPLSRAPGTTIPSVSPWVITPDEKAGYDRIFQRNDAQNIGYVTGDQAVQFFRDSGLPDAVLGDIWDLANIRKTDTLNRDEFAVAMKLIHSQRGKDPNYDLPRVLPPEVVPASLRQFVAPQQTGFPAATQSGFPATTQTSFPAATQPPQQAARPVIPQSAAEDLFGLDALTSSPSPPSLKQQGTGGSGTAPRPFDTDPFGSKTSSPTSSNFQPPRGFKPFVPTSSFGQTLQSQTTGGSASSSNAQVRDIKPPSAVDDLLGDNDPEVSKKLTKETSELANMSNQIGQLLPKMQEAQANRTATEKDVSATASQKRDLEARLTQFRSQYNEEVKAVKVLQEQLTTNRRDIQNLQREIAMLEGASKDLQTQHRQASAELENDKRNNATLRERMSQVNAETARLKHELEDMKNHIRREKGLVSINKKQLEKSEAELDAVKAEMDQLSKTRQDTAPTSPREAPAVVSPAASTSQSTNPFFRRTPQQSFDNTMSPGGFARSPAETNKQSFDNIFSTASSTSQTTAPPPTSFGFASQTGPSIQSASITSSSEPGLPTPSASPPASSHRDSPRTAEPPEPPESRQLTPGDLPLRPGRQFSESTATSVRVETPVSRLEGGGTETPTATSGPPPLERLETNRSEGSTGAALFERNKSTSPVTSTGGRSTDTDLFRTFPGTVPGTFPPSDTSSVKPNFTGGSGFSSGSRETFSAFGKESTRTGTVGSTKDFDDAFASLPAGSRPSTSGPRANGDLGDAAVERINSEFPPIPSLQDDDSDSDGDQGFDDNFTHQSPEKIKEVPRPISDVREELPTPNAQKSPPTYGETVSTGTGANRDPNQFPLEFGGLLPSRDDPTTGAQPVQSPSQGQALFGNKSPTSPPPLAETTPSSNVPSSDTYVSAASHQSVIPPTLHSTQGKKIGSFDDDFDAGFDDLEDAKADEEGHADEDDFMFASGHENSFDEFNPSFDSPSASKTNTLASERTPTSKAPMSFQNSSNKVEDSFGDFGDFGTTSKSSILPPLSGIGVSGPSAEGSNAVDWDALMKNAEEDRIAPLVASSSTAQEISKPNLGRTVSEVSEHDVSQLQNLMRLGYGRSSAVRALEKYDYDYDKVGTCPQIHIAPQGCQRREDLPSHPLATKPVTPLSSEQSSNGLAIEKRRIPCHLPPATLSKSLPPPPKALPPLPAVQLEKADDKPAEMEKQTLQSPTTAKPSLFRRLTSKLTRL